jgi:hypothetical protein
MGDLAKAIVDLGVSAQRRRDARRDLRDAIAAVVGEMTRHLRAGDWVTLYANDADPFDSDTVWAIERVSWPVSNPHVGRDGRCTDGLSFDERHSSTFDHPRGANALVLYAGVKMLKPSTRYDGAVIADPRVPWQSTAADGTVEVYPVKGRDIGRIEGSDEGRPYFADLFLATDVQQLRFADNAVRVMEAFADRFDSNAERYRKASQTIAKLAPR